MPWMCKELLTCLQILHHLGVKFVLHSDSSLHTQETVYATQFEKFGIPLLALCSENGAFAKIDDGSKLSFFPETQVEKDIIELYEKLRIIVENWCRSKGLTYFEGTPDTDLCLGAKVDLPDDTVLVMVDKHRKSSLFFDVRIIKGGIAHMPEPEEGKPGRGVVDQILALLDTECGVKLKHPYAYTMFGGHRLLDVGKAPFMRYLQSAYPKAEIFMVGDGRNDIPAMKVPRVIGVSVSTHKEVQSAAKNIYPAGPAGTLAFCKTLINVLQRQQR